MIPELLLFGGGHEKPRKSSKEKQKEASNAYAEGIAFLLTGIPWVIKKNPRYTKANKRK